MWQELIKRSLGSRLGGAKGGTGGRKTMTIVRVLIGVAVLIVGHFLASGLHLALRARTFDMQPAAGSDERGTGLEGGNGGIRVDPTAVLVAAAAYWLTMAAVVGLMMVVLGIRVASIVAALATAAVLVGFVLQGILSDLSAGIIIAVTRVFYIGEVIEIHGERGVRGVVVAFNIINTTVLDFTTRTRITVPNRRMQDSIVVNHSRQPRRVVAIDALVSNTNADFGEIARIMKRAVTEALDAGVMRRPLTDPVSAWEPVAGVFDMSEVGTKMRVTFAIDARDYQAPSLTAVQLRVREALARGGITLVDPF